MGRRIRDPARAVMTFEQFSAGRSLLHQADPRGKLISAGVLSLIFALCQQPRTALAGLLLALLLTAAARLHWAAVLRRLLVVNSFNALLLLLLPLTYGGAETVRFVWFDLSLSGLRLAALITVKSNAAVLLFISLLSTSTVARLGQGLQALRLPQNLCLLLLFSYRYLGLIHEEFLRLRRAAALRCFQPSTNLHTYRTYGHLLGMVIVRSWNRAARVQQAMALRGFSGAFRSLHVMELRRSDVLLTGALLLAALLLAALEV
ncbi:cobalt ECF transporter T component CbiQ [Candidatus Electronema sp. JC]|uniref:cobalt ECF transporter T component CbiQ n=1 Tax=Candidatus Electronema sp. JC TaxID=3401570 RepID=UPI003AA7B601